MMMIYYDPEVQAVIISQQPEDKYAALAAHSCRKCGIKAHTPK